MKARILTAVLLALAVSSISAAAQNGGQSMPSWFIGGPDVKPWWSGSSAGLVGGTAGSVCGIIGALVGILAGTGRARTFVLWLMRIVICIGVVSLAAGLVALTSAQPYHVWYPLLLLGFLCTVIFGSIFPAVKKGYDQWELRRMAAQDLR